MLKPIQDRVIVKFKEFEEKRESGIIIPEKAQRRPQEGTVIACGPGRNADDGSVIPMSVKEGDKVIVDYGSGANLEIDGEKYQVMREVNIIGIL